MGDRVKVVSTDGEEGLYVYEVDGKSLIKQWMNTFFTKMR